MGLSCSADLDTRKTVQMEAAKIIAEGNDSRITGAIHRVVVDTIVIFWPYALHLPSKEASTLPIQHPSRTMACSQMDGANKEVSGLDGDAAWWGKDGEK